MDIQKEKITVIITANGSIFVGQLDDNYVLGNKELKINYPFRLILDQSSGALKVAAPVLKEEWITINMSGTVICDVNPKIEEVYCQYCQKVFGGIVVPERKIITGV